MTNEPNNILNFNWTTILNSVSPNDYASTDEEAFSIIIDKDVVIDPNLYIAGWTSGNFEEQVNNGSQDAFVSAVDNTGDHIWSTLIGSSATDRGYAITQGNDNSLFVTGRYTDTSPSPGPNKGWEAFLTKLDKNNGDILWTRNYGSYHKVDTNEGF